MGVNDRLLMARGWRKFRVACPVPVTIGPLTRPCGTKLSTKELNRGDRRDDYYRHILVVHPFLSSRQRSLYADRMLLEERNPYPAAP